MILGKNSRNSRIYYYDQPGHIEVEVTVEVLIRLHTLTPVCPVGCPETFQ